MDEIEKLKLGGEAVKWVWTQWDEISKRLKRLNEWFSNPSSRSGKKQPGILIIGSGGVGKTTLARILAGEFTRSILEDASDYRESRNIDEYVLEDDPHVSIVVPPGQEHRRPHTWPAVYSEIAGGGYRGIILINSHGYHSFGIDYRSHPLYKKLPNPRTTKRFMLAYAEEHRRAELEVLQRISPHVQQCPRKLWFLTIVTKEDLWWKERDQVLEYYHQGSYQAEIESMLGQYDPRMRRHETVFVSLLISNFLEGNGEVLKPNAAGYDLRAQVNSLRHLLETMNDFMSWEER